MYYDRDRNGIPHAWLRVVKESISLDYAPLFQQGACSKNMLANVFALC